MDMKTIRMSAAILGISLSLGLSAQKDGRVWMDARLDACKKGKAVMYLTVQKADIDYEVKLYELNDQLKMEGRSLDPEGEVWHGEFTFFHSNGEKESQGRYIEGSKAGIWQRWNAAGTELAERSYAPYDHQRMAYKYVDEMPSFDGGEKKFRDFLKQRLSSLVNDNETQPIELGMLIAESGEVKDLEIFSNMDAAWESEAERALSGLPAWNPGKKQGEQVRVWIRLPLD